MRRLLVLAVVAAGLSTIGLSTFRVSGQETPRPIKALLVIGGCCHDYAAQKDILARGLAARANVDVTIAYEADKNGKKLNPVYENPDWAKGFDVVIHDECTAGVDGKEVVDRILQPHRDGLPAVVIHCGMHCYRVPNSDEWFKFTGLTTRNHGKQAPIAIAVDTSSPITKNLANWTTINEELYNEEQLWKTATPLARGKQFDNNYVVAWTNMYNGKTRVFATTLGHNNATVEDPRYLDLVANGLLWATGHLSDDGRPAAGYGPKK